MTMHTEIEVMWPRDRECWQPLKMKIGKPLELPEELTLPILEFRPVGLILDLTSRIVRE